MKNTYLAPITRRHDPVLEGLITSKHEELKLLAIKNAQHYAFKNLPGPSETNLDPYTSDLKNGYHQLAAQISKHLQPDSHFPEARMEIDFLKDKNKQLDEKIRNKEHEIQNVRYELGSFNPKTLQARVKVAVWTSLIIAFGEIMYNTKAFQIVGENMLFAFVISVSISVAVFMFSHLIPFLLKSVQSKILRRVIVISSLLLIIALFISLAVFRTQYMAAHGEQVSPVYFVIVNLFFFIVATLLSYFLLPTWQELKENSHRTRQYKDIEKNNDEIEKLVSEKESIKNILLERSKERIQITNYAQYSVKVVISMFRETLGIFRSTNLINRSDKSVPLCFSGTANDIEVDRFEISFTESNNTRHD